MNHDMRMRRFLEGLARPLLVTSLTNVRYLTGFTGSNAYLFADGDGATFLTDGRYGEIAEDLLAALEDVSLVVYRDGLYDRLAELFGDLGEVSLEQAHISWEAQRALAQRFRGDLVASDGIVESMRRTKDHEEVEALRRAALAGDDAFAGLTVLAKKARTEAELAEELIGAMAGAGGDRAGWPPIVAAGPNAARPHHGTSDDEIGEGLLLLDYGCVVEGYHSDMTRTVYRSEEPDPEIRAVHAAVLEANEAGIAAVAPGVPAGDVDRAVRDVLAGYGLEEHFLHSTGHGVGLEIHEGPSVRAGSTDVLELGAVVTVEPGVYLPGKFGVRIEDMVLVTASGREVLTRSEKELLPA